MRRNGGLLIFFDEENRRNLLIREKKDGEIAPFSDTLSIPDWELHQLEIVLLCFSDSTIDFLALAFRGKRVVTEKYRIEFSNLLNLNSVKIDDINKSLDSNTRHYFIKSSQGIGGRLPIKTWENALELIKIKRPELAKDIERISALNYISGYSLKGGVADILLQEREAFGTALDIFGGNNQLRQGILGGWSPEIGQVTDFNEETHEAKLIGHQSTHSSFMSGIDSRYLQEGSALQHDLFNWDGMSALHEIGTSIFYQGDRKLEVIYANHNDLEHTLGVDLIYYNEFFKSFVLVQYKLMVESGKDKEHVYRPDKQLEDELLRMDEFEERFMSSNDLKSHNDFRLNSDGFLIKLVPNYGLKPASGELLKGMYLPRSYIKFLIGPEGPKGERGGKIITFDNSPRYITNTEFVKLVNRGWIGTRFVQSDILSELIKQFYRTNKAILVACETHK